MNPWKAVGHTILAFIAVILAVLMWIVAIPFIIVYYVVMFALSIASFVVAVLFVAVYKFIAWLARTTR